MYCRGCGIEIGNTVSLLCGGCEIRVWQAGLLSQQSVSAATPRHLIFNPGDGPCVWEIDLMYDGDNLHFLIVAMEDAKSVMDAITTAYPLEETTIRGMKQLEGTVQVMQLNYEPWQMPDVRDEAQQSPASAGASKEDNNPAGASEKKEGAQ